MKRGFLEQAWESEAPFWGEGLFRLGPRAGSRKGTATVSTTITVNLLPVVLTGPQRALGTGLTKHLTRFRSDCKTNHDTGIIITTPPHPTPFYSKGN